MFYEKITTITVKVTEEGKGYQSDIHECRRQVKTLINQGFTVNDFSTKPDYWVLKRVELG